MNPEYITVLTRNSFGLQYTIVQSEFITFEGNVCHSTETSDERYHNIYDTAVTVHERDSVSHWYYEDGFPHHICKPAITVLCSVGTKRCEYWYLNGVCHGFTHTTLDNAMTVSIEMPPAELNKLNIV